MAAQMEKRDLEARGGKGHGKDKQNDEPNRLPGDDGFLEQFYVDDSNTYMTTDTGTPVDDRNSLRIGERGPTVMEDFVMRTKIQRFDHERVPGEFPVRHHYILRRGSRTDVILRTSRSC